MKKIRKTKNRIGLVGHIVDDITSTKEDETLNVKTIVDYVNNRFKVGKNGFSFDISNKDLNKIVDTGFYYGNNLVNGPKNEQFLYLISICHFNVKTYSIQIAINSGSSDTAGVYVRKQYNNNWTKWNKITTEVIE